MDFVLFKEFWFNWKIVNLLAFLLKNLLIVIIQYNNDRDQGGLLNPAFEWVINTGTIDSASDYPNTVKALEITTRHVMIMSSIHFSNICL